VIVLPSGLSLTSVTRPAAGGVQPEFLPGCRCPRSAGAVQPDYDAPDQQLQDARLLGREELIPQAIEPLQGPDHLVLIDGLAIAVCCPPDAPDELGRAAASGSD
jgi:hypothetical protein